MGPPPAFPAGAAGLVSTVDDYLAFGQMMLNKGRHGSARILSRPAVETMTTDQLTPAQKAVSGIGPRLLRQPVGLRRDHRHAARRPGGGPGGSAGTAGWAPRGYSDPRRTWSAILMTQRAWTSPVPPPVCQDFWTLAYQAIDD